MKNAIKIKRVLSLSLACSFIGSYSFAPAWAADLNLGSASATMPAAAHSSPVAINVGGAAHLVQPGAQLTPAEYMAVQQVMQTGTQQLGLDTAGRAVSGRVVLDGMVPNGLSSLVIPQGVTAINNFANTNALMNITGNLVNSGSLYAVSTDQSVRNAIINANNIVNTSGALLTSVLPANGLLGYANAIKDLSLTLNATNNLTNAGTISSAGNLNVTAGGALANSGLMQAARDINMSSTTGGAINFNGAGGTVQAGNAINVGHIGDASAIQLTGGDWLSNTLNLTTAGPLEMHVGQVSGLVNVQSNGAHVSAATPSLRFGSMCVTGDPYYINSSGDFVLGAQSELSTGTSGYPFTIIASGNITSSGSTPLTINTSSNASYGGGDVTLIAGAVVTENTGSTTGRLSVSGPSSTGGSILLDDETGTGGGAGVQTIDTRALNATPGWGGGNVTLVAFHGSGNSATTGGQVLLRADSTIKTGGTIGGISNGNVLAIAGNPNFSQSVQIGGIDTTGGDGGGGKITVVAGEPQILNGPAIYDSQGQQNYANGTYSPYFTRASNGDSWSNLQRGGIAIGAISAAGTQAPNIISNGAIYLAGTLAFNGDSTKIAAGDFNTKADSLVNIIGDDLTMNSGALVQNAGLHIHTTGQLGITLKGLTVAAGDIDILAEQGNIGGVAAVNALGGAFINDPTSPGTFVQRGNASLIAYVGDILSPGVNTLGASGGNVNLVGNNIGAAGAPVQTSTANGGLTAINASHNAFVTSSSNVNLWAINSHGGSGTDVWKLTTTNGANVTVIGADNSNFANFGIVALNAGDATIDADGAIQTQGHALISADTLQLTAHNGTIGATNLTNTGIPLYVDTASLSVSSPDNVSLGTIDSTPSAMSPRYAQHATISLADITVAPGKTFALDSKGHTSAGGPGVSIMTNAVTTGSGSTFHVSSLGDITTQQAINGGTNSVLWLEANNLNVNGDVNQPVGSPNGQTILSAGNTLLLNGRVQFGGLEGTAELSGTNGITVLPGSFVGAYNVQLTGGAIGSAGTPLELRNVNSLNIFNGTDVFANVTNSGMATNYGGGAPGVANLNLTSDSSININGGVRVNRAVITAGDSISIDQSQGSITAVNGRGYSAYVGLNTPFVDGSINVTPGLYTGIDSQGPVALNSNNVINNGTISSSDGISVSSNPSRSLTINGSGTYVAPLTSFVAPPSTAATTASIDVNGTLTVRGETKFIANGDAQSAITFAPNLNFTSTGPLTTYSKQNILAGGIHAPVTTFVAPDGYGIFSNPYPFDMVLPSNLKVVGHSVAFISNGNIVGGSGLKSIDLSNPTGQGGSLTLLAGFDFHKTGTANPNLHNQYGFMQSEFGNLYTIDGPSSNGGSVMLPGVGINTSSGAKFSASGIAGSVVAVGTKGSQGAGVVYLGDINTSASTSGGQGGDVTAIGPGGVRLGAVNTSAAFAGNLSAYAATPLIAGGPMVFQDGYIRTGARFVPDLINSVPGGTTIVKSVNSNSGTGQGGSVNIKADGPIVVLGDVLSHGLTSYTPFGTPNVARNAGGAITIESRMDSILIAGNVDASGYNFTSKTVTGDGGVGGIINITSPNSITVGKSVAANGGSSSSVPGNGGNGGYISLFTPAGASTHNEGRVAVGGIVDASGGNGQIGGNGGTILLVAGQVAVKGTLAIPNTTGASVIAQPGISKTTTAGSDGTVFIHTDSLQTAVTDLDLTETNAKSNPGVIAMNGGFLGVGLKGATNGTQGAIVTGLVPKGATDSNFPGLRFHIFSDLVGGGTSLNAHNVFVDVKTSGSSIGVREWDSKTSSMVTDYIAPGDQVTPAIALAVYEIQRGGANAQTIVPDANTNAATDRDLSGASGGHALVTLNASDFRIPIKALNTSIPGATTGATFAIHGSDPYLDLSAAKSVNIAGPMQFDSDSNVTMFFGTAATSPLSTHGTIGGASRLNIFSNAPSFVNKGSISANTFYLVPSSASFTFDNTAGAKFQGLSALGSAQPALNIAANGPMSKLTFKNEGGHFDNGVNTNALPINFINEAVPLINGAVASHTLAGTGKRAVDLTFDLFNSGSEVKIPQTAVLGGTTMADSINLTTLHATGIRLAQGSSIISGTGVAVTSSGSATLAGYLESDDGPITVSAQTGLVSTATANVSACKNLSLLANKGFAVLDGTMLNNTGLLTAKAGLFMQVLGHFQSGQYYGFPVPGAPLDNSGSGQNGSILISMEGTGQTCLLGIGGNASITSNGTKGSAGNVTIVSKSLMTGSGDFSISAYGGNVSIASASNVGFSQADGSVGNPSITAYALGDTSKPTKPGAVGGLVGITAGSSVPAVFNSKTAVAGVASSLSQAHPSSVSFSQTGGAVIVKNPSGLIELATSGTNQTNLTNVGGTIFLNSIPSKTNAQIGHINANGVNITTYGFAPIGYVSEDVQDQVFMDRSVEYVVDTNGDL